MSAQLRSRLVEIFNRFVDERGPGDPGAAFIAERILALDAREAAPSVPARVAQSARSTLFEDDPATRYPRMELDP